MKKFAIILVFWSGFVCFFLGRIYESDLWEERFEERYQSRLKSERRAAERLEEAKRFAEQVCRPKEAGVEIDKSSYSGPLIVTLPPATPEAEKVLGKIEVILPRQVDVDLKAEITVKVYERDGEEWREIK